MHGRILTVMLVVLTALPVFAQRKTEEQERARLPLLLEWAKGNDPPSRHTVFIEMSNFRKWIEPVLLEKLNTGSLQEQVLFMLVLRDRGCTKVRAFAEDCLPSAIERCEKAVIAAAQIAELHRQKLKTQRAGGDGSSFDTQIASLRRNIPWREITDGTEVAVMCEILSTFGREDALKLMVNLAIKSATDRTLEKGFRVKRSRSRRGKLMPGGTEAWNVLYNPVWEALVTLSHRSLDKKVIVAQRKKLTTFFEKLRKRDDLGFNQQAALKRFTEVEAALFKTEKTADTGETKPEDTDDDIGIIRK